MATLPANTSGSVLMPPPGVESNFIDPPSRAYQLYISGVLSLVLALLFVAARLVTRARIHRRIFLDDYFSVAAMFLALGATIDLLLTIPHGEGRHLWDVPYGDFVPAYLTYRSAYNYLCTLAVGSAKASILLFLLHLFGVSRGVRFTVYALLVITLGVTVAMVLYFAVACPSQPGQPWYAQQSTTCGALTPFAISMAIFDTGTNVVTLALPIFMIWRLILPLRLRIGLALVFLTGAIVVVLSILRAYALFAFISTSDLDITWELLSWDAASLAEINGSVMCGCIPVIKPLIQRLFPGLLPESVFGTAQYAGAGRGGAEWGRARKRGEGEGGGGGGGEKGGAEAGAPRGSGWAESAGRRGGRSERASKWYSARKADVELGEQRRGESDGDAGAGSERDGSREFLAKNRNEVEFPRTTRLDAAYATT